MGSVRPEEDFAMDFVAAEGSLRVVKALCKAVKGASKLYLATDPDREGEAIAWHVRPISRFLCCGLGFSAVGLGFKSGRRLGQMGQGFLRGTNE